jgi:hypothetical protein
MCLAVLTISRCGRFGFGCRRSWSSGGAWPRHSEVQSALALMRAMAKRGARHRRLCKPRRARCADTNAPRRPRHSEVQPALALMPADGPERRLPAGSRIHDDYCDFKANLYNIDGDLGRGSHGGPLGGAAARSRGLRPSGAKADWPEGLMELERFFRVDSLDEIRTSGPLRWRRWRSVACSEHNRVTS